MGTSTGDREPDDDRLWRALGDPTRRSILDLLRSGPQTTGDIAGRFPISRVAVMKHLTTLTDAGLVTSRKRGRERWHYVDVVPLVQLHRRWATPVAHDLAAGLDDLKQRLESDMGPLPTTIDLALDIDIAADAATVFQALVTSPGSWWGHPYLLPDTTSLELDGEVGGLLVERWDDGAFVMATVTGRSADRWLQLTGPFHLGPATVVADFRVEPKGGATRVALTFRGSGLIDPERAAGFENAWRELMGRLRTYVEGSAADD